VLAASSEVPEVLLAEAGRRISHGVKCAIDENLPAHDILRTRIRRPGFSLVHKIRCIGEGRRCDLKHQGEGKENFGGGLHRSVPKVDAR